MVVLQVHNWESDRAQFAPQATGWYVRNLAHRLMDWTDLRKPECEELANRLLKSREVCAISLAKANNRYEASSLRCLLELFGAETSVFETSAR
jgi:hypothetical protein